jgi:streptogramin lyase
VALVLVAAAGELVAAVPLGARPDAVAVGEGAVWAVSSNDGVLLRVDPGTGRVLKTVSLDHIGAPDRLAAGEGSVWIGFFVSSSSLPGQWVWRYEPSGDDLSPVGTLRTVPAALAAGLGWLWITDLAGPRVLRVQPDSGELVSSVESEGGIAIGADAVWVWDELIPRGEVSRIDPVTGDAVLVAESSFYGFEIAASSEAVWLLDQAGEAVWRLDPTTGRMSEAFPTGRIPKSIAAGESAVWVGNTRDGTVTRFDPRTADLESIDVGGIPTSIAVGEDAVWVAVDAR